MGKFDFHTIHGVDWCLVHFLFRPTAGVLPGLEWQTGRQGEQRPVMEDMQGKEDNRPSPPSQDIRDIRHRISQHRDRELGQHRAARQGPQEDRLLVRGYPTQNTDSHQEEHTTFSQRPLRSVMRNTGRHLHVGVRNGCSWADDERELDSWMRERGRLSRRQSALCSSNKDGDDLGSRSLSAPLVGIAAIGQREDPDQRRRKQLEYAADLKEQIREKKKAQSLDREEFVRSRPRYLDHEKRREIERSPEHSVYRSGYHQQGRGPSFDDDGDMHQHPATRAREREFNYPPRLKLPPEHGYYAGAYDPYFYPRYPPYPHYPPPLPHYHKYYPPSEPRERYLENPYLPARREQASARSPSPPRVHRQGKKWLDRREETDEGYRALPFTGPSGATKKSDRAAYQQELQRQIEEKKEQQERDRREKERYFSKLEEEAKNYNPWGKPGAGAPLRDEKGNIVAIRGLRTSVDGTSPRFTQLTEEELKKFNQERHAQDLSQQVMSITCILWHVMWT